MQRMVDIFKALHDNIVKWCRGRMWYVRLPILIWFAYILVNHLADST